MPNRIPVRNIIRTGEVKHVGDLGRVALEVKDIGGIRIVPFADPLDVDRFAVGDIVKFDYNGDGKATKIRKPTKADPLPGAWQERS